MPELSGKNLNSIKPNKPQETPVNDAPSINKLLPGLVISAGGGIVLASAIAAGGVLGVLTGGVSLALGVAGAAVMILMNPDKEKSPTPTSKALEQTLIQLEEQRQKPRLDAKVAVKHVIDAAHEINQQKDLQIKAMASTLVNVSTAVSETNLASAALIDVTHPLQLALDLATKNMQTKDEELKRACAELATLTHTLASTQATLAEKEVQLRDTIDTLGTTQKQLTATSMTVNQQLMQLATQPPLLIEALNKNAGFAIQQAELACLKTQFKQLEIKCQQQTQTMTRLTACFKTAVDENKRLRADMTISQINKTDATPKTAHTMTWFR